MNGKNPIPIFPLHQFIIQTTNITRKNTDPFKFLIKFLQPTVFKSDTHPSKRLKQMTIGI